MHVIQNNLVLFKSFTRFSSLLRTSFDTQKIARFYSEILGDVVFWEVSLKQVSSYVIRMYTAGIDSVRARQKAREFFSTAFFWDFVRKRGF